MWFARAKSKSSSPSARPKASARPCLAEPLEERLLMAAARARGASGYSGTLSSNATLRKQQLICDPPEPMLGSSSVLYNASEVTLVDYRGGPGYQVTGAVEVNRFDGQGTVLQPFDGVGGFFSDGPIGVETGFVQIRYTLVGESGQLAVAPDFNVTDIGGVTDGVDTHELLFDMLPNVPMTAPDYTVFAAPAGSHSGNTEDFLMINDAEQTVLTSSQLAPAAVSSAASPPVVNAYVSGTNWSPTFLNYLAQTGAGRSDFGFRLTDVSPESKTLPWANIDALTLQLTGPLPSGVVVAPSDVSITAASHRTYGVSAITFDASDNTLRVRLAQRLSFADRLTFAFDLDENIGAERQVSVNVLPGDVDRSGGALAATDLVITRNRVGLSTVRPGSGNSVYTIFGDVNASSVIDASDLVQVRNNIGIVLPSNGGLQASSRYRPQAPAGPQSIFSNWRIAPRQRADDSALFV